MWNEGRMTPLFTHQVTDGSLEDVTCAPRISAVLQWTFEPYGSSLVGPQAGARRPANCQVPNGVSCGARQNMAGALRGGSVAVLRRGRGTWNPTERKMALTMNICVTQRAI